MDSFPYDICRMCGAVSPINRVWALKLPSLVDQIQVLLQIEIKDTDKCSQLVCMQCVSKVKEFGLYAKQAKDLQKSIDSYILFQEQEKAAVQCKVEAEGEIIIFIDDESVPILEELETANRTQATSSISLPDYGDNKNEMANSGANSPGGPQITHIHDYETQLRTASVFKQYGNKIASPLNSVQSSLSPTVNKTPPKLMKIGPAVPEFSQTITATVNPHGNISFHSKIANPKNSMNIVTSNTHLVQANLQTPPTSISDVSCNKIASVNNENLFKPNDVSLPPTKTKSSIAISGFSPASSCDTTRGRGGSYYESGDSDYGKRNTNTSRTGLSGVGLRDYNRGRGDRIIDKKNGYKSGGSGYDNRSNNHKDDKARRHSYSFNGSYASGGRRGGGGNYFNSGYPYEFSGGSNRRNFNGNNNQPRKSYDGYRGRNTDGCFRGRNFGAREDNF